jgi:hypothetical protein
MPYGSPSNCTPDRPRKPPRPRARVSRTIKRRRRLRGLRRLDQAVFLVERTEAGKGFSVLPNLTAHDEGAHHLVLRKGSCASACHLFGENWHQGR